MINFTPPIKVSLFVSLIYMICFYLFQQSGNYAWLYPGNILFFGCSVLYVLFLNKKNPRLNMMALTGKGMKLSFVSSLLSLTASAIVFVINFYVLPSANDTHLVFKSAGESALLVFANAFLVNIVCGSLAAFITAGLMNERNYQPASRPLSSVK